ncbi:hypothetical protein DPMN_058010 [Dreissena polymorpha]|uniref:Uncharacterized protein n=1 Tax=Dreissena polymorpha TaxID=45954 RepID=A0A9D4C1C1_DREPO|nr:hypothetical protein DPMN_058010 [Dreissena polymorpha]
MPDSLFNRQGIRMRLRDSVQRCQTRLGTRRRLKDGLRRCQYRLGTCRRLSEVFDGARQSLRPEGHLQETPRQSATVSRP